MKDNYDLSKLKSKKKPRKNSRAKGNSFERKISKLLNERFSTKEFSRTPGSGAFATSHKNLPSHLKLYGDLITPQDFRYVIECKKGYNQENICSFFSKKSSLKAFIKQALKESKYSNKPYLIIIEQDRKKPICITDVNQIDNVTVLLHNYLIYEDKYLICLLEDFLALPDCFFLS